MQNRLWSAQSGAWSPIRLAAALVCLWLAATASCRADIFVLVSEPYGTYGRWNPTGHSLIGFDRLCAASLTRLRPCKAGEMGAVISRYHSLNDYDWLAMPVMPYLYGVKNAAEVPPYATREYVTETRDRYRREYLQKLAPDNPDGSAPAGNWYELVGSAYDRTIHVFRLPTTAAQDEALMQWLNDEPNRTRYSLFLNNCADFVRETVDRVYPKLITRHMLPDLRITTPRMIAQSITRYQKKHPELNIEAWTICQVPGDQPRSHRVHGVSDGLLVTGYAAPFAFVVPVAVGAVTADFLWRGRAPLYPQRPPVLDPAAAQSHIEQPPLEARTQPVPHAGPVASGGGTLRSAAN